MSLGIYATVMLHKSHIVCDKGGCSYAACSPHVYVVSQNKQCVSMTSMNLS